MVLAIQRRLRTLSHRTQMGAGLIVGQTRSGYHALVALRPACRRVGLTNTMVQSISLDSAGVMTPEQIETRLELAMHLLAVCGLIIGLPSLLILGFLVVAHDLLSRSVIGAPTSSATDAFPNSRRRTSRWRARGIA
jgi:hypothetical protein